MLQPFNINLNVCAHIMAARSWPRGYRLSDLEALAAGSLETLQAQIGEFGSPVIWKGASENTIFADPETNWAFRAWHDWAHAEYSLPFTLEGEAAAALVQCAQAVERYGPDADMCALILCEVVGQARYFAELGRFPDDQRAFTNLHLATYQAAGEWAAHALEGRTDAAAIGLAPRMLQDTRTLGARG